jgi:phage terminase small subunit
MSKELTPKQKRFADEYLIDLNATAAYKRAGYSGQGNVAEVSAHNLLRNIKVGTYIQTAMDKRSKSLGIDAEYVLQTIKTTIERCSQSHPVLDRKGDPVMIKVGDGENATFAPAYEFDAANVLKGSELLGKHLKMFTDKLDVGGQGDNPIKIDATPFDAARRIAMALAAGMSQIEDKS